MSSTARSSCNCCCTEASGYDGCPLTAAVAIGSSAHNDRARDRQLCAASAPPVVVASSISFVGAAVVMPGRGVLDLIDRRIERAPAGFPAVPERAGIEVINFAITEPSGLGANQGDVRSGHPSEP